MKNQEMANNVKAVIDENAAILQKLAEMVGQNTDKLRKLLELVDKVDDDGYLEVDGIVRRWVPSQCLKMLYSPKGFHKELTERWNAYDYGWKVLLNDLEAQLKLHDSRDRDGENDRCRWYNKSVARGMAEDYISQLRDYVSHLPRLNCKGREYVKVRTWLNAGKGVFVDELDTWYGEFEALANAIKRAGYIRELHKAVYAFNQKRKQTHLPSKALRLSGEFVNAYKAAGGYYTAKDLIMFEGCLAKGCNDRNESIVALEEAAACAEDMVGTHGFKMLGFLRELLKCNGFDYDAINRKWAEQSKKRRAYRQEQRGMRRSR